MKKRTFTLAAFTLALLFQSCTTDHVTPTPDPQAFVSQPFADGLKAPIGLASDDQGNIWVSEAGTGNGNNDGSISVITPSGQKTLFVTGLSSMINQGSIEGVNHLLYRSGKLYFLHGLNGLLYTADVSGFKPGDPAVNLATIPTEDIATYVKSLALTDPLNSNAFDLVFGPDDHLYIVDSGGNAIIKRDKTSGALSLFAQFPGPVAGVDAVPTGVVYDGSRFLVSTLTGFPFTPGNAKIFQVDNAGNTSVYKSGFTTLSGVVLSVNSKPIVIQHGTFGAMGFEANSGKVLDENGNTLLSNISQPTDIIRVGDKTYYLLSYRSGTISKLSY